MSRGNTSFFCHSLTAVFLHFLIGENLQNHIGVDIYDAFMIRESIKEIHGRFYDPDDKAWLVPLTEENAGLLAWLGVELASDLIPQHDGESCGEATYFSPPVLI